MSLRDSHFFGLRCVEWTLNSAVPQGLCLVSPRVNSRAVGGSSCGGHRAFAFSIPMDMRLMTPADKSAG